MPQGLLRRYSVGARWDSIGYTSLYSCFRDKRRLWLQCVNLSWTETSPETLVVVSCTPGAASPVWVERKDHVPQLAVSMLSNVAEDTICLICSKDTLLGVHQDHQVIFCQVALNLGVPSHVLVPGIVSPQMQDFEFLCFELHEVPVSPFLQTVKVPMNGSSTQLFLFCYLRTWWCYTVPYHSDH